MARNQTQEQKALNKEKELYNQLSNILSDFKDTKDLIVKEAILLGEKRVSYCKGKDLVQVINANYAQIQQSLLTVVEIDIGPEANQESYQKIFEVFFKYKLLLKLYRMEGDTLKYPKRLFPPKREDNIITFDDKVFYWINIQREASKMNMVYLLVSVVAILLICMFPIWPLKVKIGFFWTLIVVLVSLLVFTILSLVVVFVGIIFGYDIFIFPNLLETKQSWKERLFYPIVAYYPREDSCFLIFIRINMGLAIVLLGVVAWLNPGLFSTAFTFIGNMITNSYSYIQTKIISQHTNSTKPISLMDRHNKIINDIDS